MIKSEISEERCEMLPFGLLCETLEQIAKAAGAKKKKEKLQRILSKQLYKELYMGGDKDKGKNGDGDKDRDSVALQSIYPLLRLLLPHIDSERGRYNLKQTMVAKTYVEALKLSKNSSFDTKQLNTLERSLSTKLERSFQSTSRCASGELSYVSL